MDVVQIIEAALKISGKILEDFDDDEEEDLGIDVLPFSPSPPSN
jgi:hypothetical protein